MKRPYRLLLFVPLYIFFSSCQKEVSVENGNLVPPTITTLPNSNYLLKMCKEIFPNNITDSFRLTFTYSTS